MYRRMRTLIAVVVVLVASGLSGVALLSCGSGGGGGDGVSNGLLCDQCGDTDGPCLDAVLERGEPESLCPVVPLPPPTATLTPPPSLTATATPTPRLTPTAPAATLTPTATSTNPTPTASATPTPSATPPATGPTPVPTVTPCTVKLTCLRKLGSAQRRCYPFTTDAFFECDGARANPGSSTSPTPGPGDSAATVDVTVDSETLTTVPQFVVTVMYKQSVGSFDPFSCKGTDTDDHELAVVASDNNGTGTLTLTVSRSGNVALAADISCPFNPRSGAELTDNDITKVEVDNTQLTVEASVGS